MLHHAFLHRYRRWWLLDTLLLFCFVFLVLFLLFTHSSAVSAHGHTCTHTSYLSDVGADLPMSTFAFA